jgi:hypothetical protein
VEPKVSEQHQVITSAAVKSEKIQPNQKTTSSSKTDATRKPSSVSSTSTTTSSTTPIQSPHVSLVQLEATKPELTKKLSSVVPYPTLTSSMSSPSQILAADNAQSQAQYKQIKGEPQIPKSFIQQQQKSLKDTETDSNTLESEVRYLPVVFILKKNFSNSKYQFNF